MSTKMSSTPLHDLLRTSGNVDWRQVLKRTSSHPHEACTKRGGGCSYRGRPRYPLQLALSRFRDAPAPPEVISALLEAHPNAIYDRDEIGNTPLYYATIHATSYVVQMILDANPSAASQPEKYYEKLPIHVARDENTGRILLTAYPDGVGIQCHGGHLPLHRACLNRDASPELCRLLIEEGKKRNLGGEAGQGGAFVPDLCGKTPIDYCCDKLLLALHTSSNFCPIQLHLWRKFSMLATAVLPPLQCRDASNNLLTLHAMICMGCPSELIEAAIRMHPNQVNERDCLGRSCLAVAASKQDTSSVVIDMLVNATATAANGNCIADLEGKMPLHHAAESGRAYDYALRAILASNPLALVSRDHDGNFPLMLAAIGEKSDVNVVYNLLREAPTVVSA